MGSVKTRLEALRAFLDSRTTEETVFVVDGGDEFRTPLDPWEYLLKHGVYTPEGERIVKYPHPVHGIDPLSLSLYELIDEAIERGKVDFPDPETLKGDEP